MPKPTPYEIELIQRITRVTVKLEQSKKKHADICSTQDPTSICRCTCGAGEFNSAIDKLILELDLRTE